MIVRHGPRHFIVRERGSDAKEWTVHVKYGCLRWYDEVDWCDGNCEQQWTIMNAPQGSWVRFRSRFTTWSRRDPAWFARDTEVLNAVDGYEEIEVRVSGCRCVQARTSNNF